jgi:hypothetical protein
LPDGIFSNKIPILVNFEGPCNGTCWYILWPLSILRPFGIFCGFYGHLVFKFHVLVCCTKKSSFINGVSSLA